MKKKKILLFFFQNLEIRPKIESRNSRDHEMQGSPVYYFLFSYTLPRFYLNDLTHYHKIFVDITTQNRCTFGMCLYVLLFNDVKISEWSKFQMCTNHKSWFAVLLWSLNKGTYRIYLWFLSLILWCYTYNTKQLVWTYCLDYQNCQVWLLLQPFQQYMLRKDVCLFVCSRVGSLICLKNQIRICRVPWVTNETQGHWNDLRSHHITVQ